jgi:hypothetical protein
MLDNKSLLELCVKVSGGFESGTGPRMVLEVVELCFSGAAKSVISARVKQRKTFFNAYSLSLFSLLKELLLFSVTC